MKKLIALTIILFPGLMFANFTPDMIWVSQDSIIEGDTVDVYVTVFNTSGGVLEGVVEYYNEETLLGDVPVSVSKDSAELVILSWKPKEGRKSVSAKFLQNEDVVEETKRVSVSVAPAPVKETADSQEAFNQVTLPDQVGSIETPQIAHTTVNIAEQGRLATVEFFEKQQEKIQEKRADQKEEVVVINNSEDDKPKPSVQDVAQEVGQTGLLAMVGALSFISRSAWLFYGLFLLLIILVARKLIKHHRRREEY